MELFEELSTEMSRENAKNIVNKKFRIQASVSTYDRRLKDHYKILYETARDELNALKQNRNQDDSFQKGLKGIEVIFFNYFKNLFLLKCFSF